MLPGIWGLLTEVLQRIGVGVSAYIEDFAGDLCSTCQLQAGRKP
jgi:hypothetical protein